MTFVIIILASHAIRTNWYNLLSFLI